MNSALTNDRDNSTQPDANFPPRHAGRPWLRIGCLAWLCFAALSAQAGFDIFMRIGGQAAPMNTTQSAPLVPGTSADPQYPNWMPVFSFSHGVSLSVYGTNVDSKSDHQNVAMQRALDIASPSLNLLVNGNATGLPVSLPIDYVTIDLRTTGGSNVFYRVELQKVYLTSVQLSGSAGGDAAPTESVTLTYQQIRWTYVPFTNGKAGTAVTKGWDTIKNMPF